MNKALLTSQQKQFSLAEVFGDIRYMVVGEQKVQEMVY